jgi:hypothetical protein
MEDSRRALAGFNGSDGWLIVHSCQAGEFDAEEVRSLEAMRAELHGAALEPALLTCVLSKSDTRDPSEVESIERRCREQLASVLGMENTHWVRTGVEAYFEAQALGRARRVEASGLPALRTRVAEMVNTVRLRREALAEERAVAIMTEARELFRTRADEATRLEKKLVRERRERFARIREELAELGTAMRETLTVAQGGK